MGPRREYTKSELRHRHSQEKAKAEKRKRQRDKEHISVKRARKEPSKAFEISSTQAGKIVSWFREIDFTKTTWMKTRDVLATKLGDAEPKLSDEAHDSIEAAMAKLYLIGEALADRVSEVACNAHRNDDDELHWAKKMVKEGALNDQATSATILITSCPVVSSRQLDQILKHTHAINRTEHSMGLKTFLELWRDKNIIPNDVELQVFTTPNDVSELKQEFKLNQLARKHFIKRKKDKFHLIRQDELLSDSYSSRLLLSLIFEHQLVQLGASVLKVLQKRALDPVEYTRHETYTAAIDLIKKPTLRETAARLALKFLSDTSSTLTNRMHMEVGKFLLSRQDLKAYICSRVNQMIWMQKVDSLELSRRDALISVDGRIKARESRGISLARRAHDAKKQIISVIDKEDEKLLRREKNTSTAHKTVCNCLRFLSDMSYQSADEELLKEQFTSYLRVLQKIMTPAKAPKLERVQQKQIRFIRSKQLAEIEDETLTKAAEKVQGELTQYIIGLGHSIVGSAALRYLLLAFKRLIPFCTDELLASIPVITPPSEKEKGGAKDKGGARSKEESPGVRKKQSTEERSALSQLGSEVMKVAHQVPCFATRIHAWLLCHSIFKRSRQEHFLYANLYAQLKDFRYMQTRAKNAWMRLHISVIKDVDRCPATIRAAFLRRLLSVSLLQDIEAGPLPLLMILKQSLRTEETALGEWVSECLGARAASGLLDQTAYDYDVFAPEKSEAMQSSLWELSLARCSLVPSISNAYEDLARTIQAQEEEQQQQSETTQTFSLDCWDELLNRGDGAESDDDSLSQGELEMSSQIYKLAQRSQTLQVINRILQGQTLRAAIKDKVRKEEKEETGSADDLEVLKSVWDYDIYDEKLWRTATNFLFPFRAFIEPAFKHTARSRHSFKDFDDEVDKFADRWIETQ